MIIIDDYSTETGLRVRISSTTTGSVVHLVEDEWLRLKAHIEAGDCDHLAKEPKVPFVHWPEGAKTPTPQAV